MESECHETGGRYRGVSVSFAKMPRSGLWEQHGNITEIRENSELKNKYTYDKLGLLIREGNAAAGKSFTHEFE